MSSRNGSSVSRRGGSGFLGLLATVPLAVALGVAVLSLDVQRAAGRRSARRC
jgi:hypothetical protein